MPLTDQTKLQAHLGVTDAVAASLIKHLRSAEAHIRTLKGDAWYDTMETTSDTQNSRQVADEAESRFCLFYGLLSLNLRIDDAGGIYAAEIGAGTGTETRYLTPAEVRAYAEDVLREALLLLSGKDVTTTLDADDEKLSYVRVGIGRSEVRMSHFGEMPESEKVTS